MSIAFSFFSESEASMAEIYSRLSTPAANRRIDMRVIRNNFFAVAGGGDIYGTYSRFIPIAGGIVGFTVSWNTTALPNGIRVAVLMANGLLPSHAKPDDQPLAPPQVASLEPPRTEPPKPVTVTGSALFVSETGDLVTNNHVIKAARSPRCRAAARRTSWRTTRRTT